MSKSTSKKKLSAREQEQILDTLQKRFEKNTSRHKGIDWSKVKSKLDANPDKLWSLFQMEETGGEPDVVGLDKKSGSYIFYDCSAETPKGRRSICFDQAAWDSRKEHKPSDNAEAMSAAMGIEILNEEEYRELQKLGEFDLKTSTWIGTPAAVRKLGGALFCDRRFNMVFTYHNGAESYYAARGFRGKLLV